MLTLETLLDGLAIGVEPFALCEVRGLGRLELGPREHPSLHYTLGGSGRIVVAGGTAIEVRAHTVLVVPAGLAHEL